MRVFEEGDVVMVRNRYVKMIGRILEHSTGNIHCFTDGKLARAEEVDLLDVRIGARVLAQRMTAKDLAYLLSCDNVEALRLKLQRISHSNYLCEGTYRRTAEAPPR